MQVAVKTVTGIVCPKTKTTSFISGRNVILYSKAVQKNRPGRNERPGFFMYKQHAMNHVLMRIVVWVIAYIIQWLIEKRREHINQNRNAVTSAVAKN